MPKTKLENPGYLKAKPRIAIFEKDERYYILVEEQKVQKAFEAGKWPTLNWLQKVDYRFVTGSVGEMSTAELCFLAYNADCAFLPDYIVFADAYDDVSDIFIDETTVCKVKETDIVDYDDDDLVQDSDGDYHDISKLFITEVRLHSLLY